MLLAAMFAADSSFASVCTQNNNQVGFAGLDDIHGRVYAAVSGHNNDCSCNSFRFTPANTDHKMALGILLTARISGETVRIDLLDSADCDSAYRVCLE